MSKHIHILGICGTFMGSLAQLAKASGFHVTGSDKAVYPPMSSQLEAAGIELIEGFSAAQLDPVPDLVIVGNVISRGNPAMEAVLNRGIPYISGPQWLSENILRGKWVMAVAGTHGKTTTTSMLAWILEFAGMSPGYLIGGVPVNFGVSARLGGSDFFVIEADEYDTAFFDKRSKFVHYGPRTLVINNVEFDHADIFPDLSAIQRQFHHLVRTVPGDGLVLSPESVPAVAATLAMGCWTPRQAIASEILSAEQSNNTTGTDLEADWHAQLEQGDGTVFNVYFAGNLAARVEWNLTGNHNVSNALSAIAAARHVGIAPEIAGLALCEFLGVKRRMELLGEFKGVCLYDDFAHHPTAIESTLAGLRKRVGDERIIAVIEPRSNTMQKGIHKSELRAASRHADYVIWRQPSDLPWDLRGEVERDDGSVYVCTQVEDILSHVLQRVEKGAHVVIMSNGGFDGIHQRLAIALSQGARHD